MFTLALASHQATQLHQTANESVDAPRQPLFCTNFASESALHCFKVNGDVPERKIWNWENAQDRLGETSKCSFSLKTMENRDWKMARSDAKKRAKGLDPLAPDEKTDKGTTDLAASGQTDMAASNGSMEIEKKPLKRAEKYYQALMKAEKTRIERVRREEWEEYLYKAGRAAEKAKEAVLKAEKKAADEANGCGGSSSSESEESDAAESEEDPGPLVPFPGVMKVEVEVVVLRAPGNDTSDTESSVDHGEAHTPSTASEGSGSSEVDWNKELQALQEEFGDHEVEAPSEGDSLPDGLGGRTIGNCHDAWNKRTALGLGGTAFFVPDVERYAFAPSLLPPPPRGEGHLALTGHKRLKLKPRLPLEVSRHRWRDEHPYGCPAELGFQPNVDDLRSWEEKVRRVELYGTLNKIITRMPKPDGIRKLPKKDDFEKSLDRELKDSLAWQQYIKRARLLEIARAEKADAGQDEVAALLKGYTPGKPKAPEATPGKPQTSGASPDGSKPQSREKSRGASRPTSAKRSKRKNLGPRMVTSITEYPGPPPLKMASTASCPNFRVGSSPPSSPKGQNRTIRKGLMSVAGGVRKGAPPPVGPPVSID